MVIDTIDNLEKYVTLNPLFKDVIDFIAANDLNKLDDGKHLIKGSDLFVNTQTAKGKTREGALLETHKKMIDIQIPLSTSETYGYTPLRIFRKQNIMLKRILQNMQELQILM